MPDYKYRMPQHSEKPIRLYGSIFPALLSPSLIHCVWIRWFLCVLHFVVPVHSSQPQSIGAFVSIPQSSSRLRHYEQLPRQPTSLPMVFDFFKKRATEGIDQITKLTDAASRGELARGLTEVAAYTSEANRAFASGLAKSRAKLLNDIDNMVNNEGRDVLEDLETLLLQSDLGLATTEDIMKEVTSLRLDGERFFSKQDLMAILRGKLLEALRFNESESKINFASPDATTSKQKLTVLLFMGANGMGKTTTIGKLAHRLRTEGNQKVLLAACDTFRAGAVDQLQLWAERAEVECFIPSATAQVPSAVLYGALDHALKGEFDTLIVDTSGRLSNNEALTAQLAKMKRVIQKRLSVEDEEVDGKKSPKPNTSVPHETLLVIDAAQGRMALDSALQWNKEIGLTGLILTKLDGSARGGSVVAVSRELQLPVKLVGVGEAINDLKDFNAETFVDSLLGIGTAGGEGGRKNDEGRQLAERLKVMRKARDERADDLQNVSVRPKTELSTSSIPDMEASISELAISKKKSLNNNKKKKKKGNR